MKKNQWSDFCITGVGVISSIGQGTEKFFDALIKGKSKFDILQRPGRQINDLSFLGAEIPDLDFPVDFPKKLIRNASFSTITALLSIDEAWKDALIKDNFDQDRIGLIVGGSNFQQRHNLEYQLKYKSKANFLNPTYGFSFFDSDLSALCSEYFGIKGMASTIGGASASGQLAIIEAVKALQLNQVDICIVVGALMDLSFWELQGFKALGAMGSEQFKEFPSKASRPYDSERDGFIYGENCGVLVLERDGERNNIKPYARLTGWAQTMDANRNPNPSYQGELKAIQQALNQAEISSSSIDYINPHGTGSPLGDETELNVLTAAKLNHAHINSTKSIIGHGLTSAGTIEVIATLLQMQNGKLHSCLNLDTPINKDFNWVNENGFKHEINKAITLSMGFGGINTALCLERN